MHTTEEVILLSERDESYIGICKCCSTINFIYKNIAIKFKENEFEFFKKYMDELRTDVFLFESRTGKNIFMSSPINNIVFGFSKREIEELKILLHEASLMLEIHQVLK